MRLRNRVLASVLVKNENNTPALVDLTKKYDPNQVEHIKIKCNNASNSNCWVAWWVIDLSSANFKNKLVLFYK